MDNRLIEKIIAGNLEEYDYLSLLKDLGDTGGSFDLFRIASCVRDLTLGRRMHIIGSAGPILPCKLKPHCRYCNHWRKKPLSTDELIAIVKIMERNEIEKVSLFSGTRPGGYDGEIERILALLKRSTTPSLEVNIGPSFSMRTLRRLKQAGLCSDIAASLETLNVQAFAQAKPGDNLQRRIELLGIAQIEGFQLRSIMMVGCGETDTDRVRHLFFLRQFNRLRHLTVSRFTPKDRTPWRSRPECPRFVWAQTIALARIILPHVHIGLGSGCTNDDIPLWHLAGGGNQLFGMAVSANGPRRTLSGADIPVTHAISIANQIPLLRAYFTGLGCTMSFKDEVLNRTGPQEEELRKSRRPVLQHQRQSR